MADDPIELDEMLAAYRAVARPSGGVKGRIAAAFEPVPARRMRRWPVAAVVLAAAAIFVVVWRGGWAGALLEHSRIDTERHHAPYDDAAVRPDAIVDAAVPVERVSDEAPSAVRAGPTLPADGPLAPVSPARVEPPRPDAAARAPARAPTSEPTAVVAGDEVLAEVALLERARAHVAASHGADALAVVDQYARDFPHGHLGEERDALRVLASCLLADRRAAALSLRRGFLRRYSRSTYAERVRAACREPEKDADEPHIP